jgi:hypothetical protein
VDGLAGWSGGCLWESTFGHLRAWQNSTDTVFRAIGTYMAPNSRPPSAQPYTMAC